MLTPASGGGRQLVPGHLAGHVLGTRFLEGMTAPPVAPVGAHPLGPRPSGQLGGGGSVVDDQHPGRATPGQPQPIGGGVLEGNPWPVPHPSRRVRRIGRGRRGRPVGGVGGSRSSTSGGPTSSPSGPTSTSRHTTPSRTARRKGRLSTSSLASTRWARAGSSAAERTPGGWRARSGSATSTATSSQGIGAGGRRRQQRAGQRAGAGAGLGHHERLRPAGGRPDVVEVAGQHDTEQRAHLGTGQEVPPPPRPAPAGPVEAVSGVVEQGVDHLVVAPRPPIGGDPPTEPRPAERSHGSSPPSSSRVAARSRNGLQRTSVKWVTSRERCRRPGWPPW